MTTENKKYQHITGLEFGREMLTWQSNGVYPLEQITSIEFTDDNCVFYAPAIEVCGSGDIVITGNKNGYTSREELMRCVGQAWDHALNEQ